MKALALILAVMATGASAEEVRFVGCPMYRDTDQGRKSGCWLVRGPADGVTYDVSGAPSLPDWQHGVLVEGRVSDAADACGGVVMDPVRASVLDDMPCPGQILPADGHKGRKFALPKTLIRPLYAPGEPVSGPFAARTFRLYFHYGSAFFAYQSTDFQAQDAALWLVAARPRHIVITGYAATRAERISGRVLREPRALARERAKRAALWLTRIGVDPATITIRTSTRPDPVSDPAISLDAPSLRRVEIQALF